MNGLKILFHFFRVLLTGRSTLAAENLPLRYQLAVLRQSVKRPLWLLILLAVGTSHGVLYGPALAESVPASAVATDGFKLQDFLGRTWRNESVRFPLSEAQSKKAKAGKALVGPDGQVLYQLVPDASDNKIRIEFLADLNPFETRVYHFTDTPAKVTTDLRIEETDDLIRLSNSVVGIAIRKKLKNGAGPIESIRLTSGRWIGASELISSQKVVSSKTEVVARGPVFSEVICRVEFEGEKFWKLRFRLQANEPVILVDESFSLQGNSSFILSIPASTAPPPVPPATGEPATTVEAEDPAIAAELAEEDDKQSADFSPDSILYRIGKTSYGKLATWKFVAGTKGTVFRVEPWLNWWRQERQGTWFALYNEKNEKSPDLLAIAAREADVWITPTPGRNWPRHSAGKLILSLAGKELKLRFPFKHDRRKWMITALEKNAGLASLKDNKLYQTPLPQEYLIKHSDFPLNRVKDYVFEWPGADKDEHPRLYIQKKDLPEIRKTFKTDARKLAQHIRSFIKFRLPRIEGPLSYYLGTGDPELGRLLARRAVGLIQGRVNLYLKQNGTHSTLGIDPVRQRIAMFPIMNLVDAMLDTEYLDPEQQARIRAQIAFLGYTFDRDDFWSHERGYSANPNMSSMVAGMHMAIACMIPSHPMAATWVKRAMRELKSIELDVWAGPNGGWLEAPGYAMYSYDHLVAAFLMARNSGFEDHLYHPKMKKVIEWLAKISTPPDSRLSGFRHLPPIGNTNMCEPSGEFGLVAFLWRDKDPEFASQMQWMYRQQGSRQNRVVGSILSNLMGYRTLLTDSTIPEKAPAWKSELFPSTGVILRNGFPSDRETQLHMIAGRHHSHYDFDSGSITLWGKGRILAEDSGYYGQAPGADHSMVISPVAGAGGIMRVKAFAASEKLDYVLAVKNGWTRQIAFVKDLDPLGPNYFVLCDSLSKPAPATWRLWLMARNVTGPNVTQKEKPTVDIDILSKTPKSGTPEEKDDVDREIASAETARKASEASKRNQNVRVEGREDVDMDIFFSLPRNIKLTAEEKTRTSKNGISPNGRAGRIPTTQIRLISTLQKVSEFTLVLYPRLKTEKPATFTSVAEGKGVKVVTKAGTDYVFLSPKPFTFEEGTIAFEGTVGTIQVRGNQVILSLGAAGSIAAHGHALEAQKAAGPSTGKIKR